MMGGGKLTKDLKDHNKKKANSQTQLHLSTSKQLPFHDSDDSLSEDKSNSSTASSSDEYSPIAAKTIDKEDKEALAARIANTIPLKDELPSHSSSFKSQGASTMDTVKDKDQLQEGSSSSSKASASSSSNSAAAATAYDKASVDTLKIILKDIAIYFAIEKPLSTQANSSTLNQAAGYIPGSSLMGARVRTTKHHMLDHDYHAYRASYGEFLTALHKTKAENGKEQQIFITSLKTLKAKYITNSRYITHQTHLCDQFILASKAEDKNLLTDMIKEAQAFHAPSPIPGAKAPARDVATYVKYGYTLDKDDRPKDPSPRKMVVLDALKKIPDEYQDSKKTDSNNNNNNNAKNIEPQKSLPYHQLDAEISIAATSLDEHKKVKNPDNLDLIHVLYHALNILLKIHHKVANYDEHEIYMKQIAKEQETLQHYRSVYKEYAASVEHPRKGDELPAQPMTLPEICEGIATKCTALSGRVNNLTKLDAKDRKLDPHFAMEYMKEISAYATQALTLTRLNGMQQEFPDVKKAYETALQVQSAGNLKKTTSA